MEALGALHQGQAQLLDRSQLTILIAAAAANPAKTANGGAQGDD
jgi:hypothetical protein